MLYLFCGNSLTFLDVSINFSQCISINKSEELDSCLQTPIKICSGKIFMSLVFSCPFQLKNTRPLKLLPAASCAVLLFLVLTGLYPFSLKNIHYVQPLFLWICHFSSAIQTRTKHSIILSRASKAMVIWVRRKASSSFTLPDGALCIWRGVCRLDDIIRVIQLLFCAY